MGAKLGQHFLREPRIARRILDAAEIQPGERVLEIGPGGGVLTDELVQAVGSEGHVVAIEADAHYAAERAADGYTNLTIVHGDALQVDLAALGPFGRIVANLPYQISGPITVRLLDLLSSQGWKRAVLMYQKEFADRLLAGPGSRQYGRLSVQVARWCKASKVRDVPPGCFEPPPKVQSTVVCLDPYPQPPFHVADEGLWSRIVDGTFGQRRKQLKNTLPAAAGISAQIAAEVLGDMATLRPEQIAPEGFAALVARIIEVRDA